MLKVITKNEINDKFKKSFDSWKDFFLCMSKNISFKPIPWAGTDKNLLGFGSMHDFVEWYCDHPVYEQPHKDFGFIMREFSWISDWFKPKNIVEIGTYFGAGMFFLNMFNHEANLTSIDINKFHMYGLTQVETGHIANINNIKYKQIFSDSSFAVIDEPFDMCFIDGDHSPCGVKKDSLWAWDNKKDGRHAILWHDCHIHRKEFKSMIETIDSFSKYVGVDIFQIEDSATAWLIKD